MHDFSKSRLTIGPDGIALFEHQRPEARNPLGMALREDYVRMLDIVEASPNVRALVLTGGPAFCAGGDVKGMHARRVDPRQTAPSATRRRILDLHEWLRRLRDIEIPVIAAVDGPAFGGGFAIALCADFVLATPRAAFCMVFLRIGALPDMGAIHLLPRVVGLQRAKELLMTGRRVTADEAHRLGIVHSIHAPERLGEAAAEMARRFLPAPRSALGMTKRLVNRSYELDAGTMAELEACAQSSCLAEPDHTQAVERFVRGESPAFDWDRDVNEP